MIHRLIRPILYSYCFQNQTRIEFEDGYWKLNDRIYLDDDGSLVITEAQIEEDNGKYICKAENKYGKATASAFVVVTKKTVLKTEGKDIPFAAGLSVTFDCEAEVDFQDSNNSYKSLINHYII